MIVQETGTPPTAPSAASLDRTASQDPASTPQRPSPSLASISFTQLLSLYDEASAEAGGATASSAAARGEATLSVHDCVLLKLSLTCALCGGLLRRQPAAIETCGHCFCYDCINDALEDGCAPLTAQWPWSTLAAEVAGAEARWTAAANPSASTSVEPSISSRRTTVRPTRLPRKVRQQCPLCLAPAFKWMLVQLPPLAQLCSALHAAYPRLEDTLAELDAGAVRPLSHALTEGGCDGAEAGALGSLQTPASAPALGAADLVLSAFAPRIAAREGRESPSDGDAEDGEEDADDEEAVRRRRRSSGGPRKEITFAADLVARVSSSTAPDAPCVAASERGLSPTSPGEEEGEEEGAPSEDAEVGATDLVSDSHAVDVPADAHADVPTSTSMASLQLSADLIPSPGAPDLRLPEPLVAPRSWHSDASLHPLAAAQLCCPDEVLGHSPAEAETEPSGDDGAAMSLANAVDKRFVLPPMGMAPMLSFVPPSSPPPWRVLLDAAPLHQHHGSRCDDYGAPRHPSPGELRTLVLGAAPHGSDNWLLVCDAVSVNGAHQGCLRPDVGDAPHTPRAYSSIVDSSDAVGAALESVPDVWALDTALVRRHPRLPRCLAALRLGRLQWDGHTADVDSAGGEAAAPIACVVGHYPVQPPTAPALPSPPAQLRRTLSVLSPAACTALVLGVPCLDVAWFSAASSCSSSSPSCPAASWLSYTVESWHGGGGAVVGESSTPPPRRDAFQKLRERLQSTPSGTATTQQQQQHRRRRRDAAPASWMAATRHALLAHLHSPLRRFAAGGPAGGTHLFLVLPDGALRLLGRLLRRDGVPSAAAQPEGGARGAVLQDSRKRPRAAEETTDAGLGGDDDWGITDGHSQAAWRRLVLVAGGAVVELQCALFHAFTEAVLAVVTTAASRDDAGIDGNSRARAEVSDVMAAVALLPHGRSSLSNTCDAGGACRGSWVHVDVAGTSSDVCTPEAGSETSHHDVPPRHTLLLLYGARAAQSAASEAGERDSPAQSNMRRLHTLLDGLARLVAEAVAPVLPGDGTVGHETRPAHWLLENIAEGRRSAGSCTTAAAATSSTAPASTSAALLGGDGAPEGTIGGGSGPAQVRPAAQEAHTSAIPTSAEDVLPQQEVSLVAGSAVRHRAGVYRSLLYADTP